MTATPASADLEVLKRAHPIASVVSDSGLRLRGRGRVLQAPCPFHEDHEPSFTVYRDTQRFYCFGCGVAGDVLDYVRLTRRVDFAGALRLLEAGTSVTSSVRPAIRPAERCEEPAVPANPVVLAATARFYAGHLPRHRAPVEYLASRGISFATAVNMGVGYAPGSGLREHLERADFPSDAIKGSGLFVGDRERFEGRVVVPHVANARVTWMVGRAIDPCLAPRFQALPGTKPVLGAGRLRPPQSVVLTEGLFDWLTLVQWGLPAYATLGGHSLERVVTALSGCRRVYLAMDADEAGRDATERLTVLLGPRAVPLSLPAGIKDVADLATLPDGRRTFLRLIERAKRGHCQ